MPIHVNPNVNINSGYGPPTKAWYVRDNRDDTNLFGPVTLTDADAVARYQSKHNNLGLAEVVIIRGGKILVVSMFIRGRKTAYGRKAQFLSDNRLPPTPF